MTKQEILDALQAKHERARQECIRMLEQVATSPGGSCTITEPGSGDAEAWIAPKTRDMLAELSTQCKQMNAISELVSLVHQLCNEGAAKPAEPAQVLQ